MVNRVENSVTSEQEEEYQNDSFFFYLLKDLERNYDI